jgi:pimeloyl-ACP methyl ester carboxylesterase
MTLVSKWANVGGLRMHARVSIEPARIDSAPIVLVHGLVVSSRYMIPTAVRLAPYYSVYAPDLPGFGRSDHPPHVLNIAQLADALASWMRAMKIGPAVLLGNSMGCQVIADVAARYPALIERAVLVGPTMDRSGRTALEQGRRLLIAATRDHPALIGVQIRDLWSAGLRATLATMRYGLEDRIEANLPRISIPTLVVCGERDPIAPQRWAQEVTGQLRLGQLSIIAGAGHALNYSAPADLVHVVRTFLQQQDEVEPCLPHQNTICASSGGTHR